MICSRCRRPLKSAAVTGGGLTIGPVCARKMGLTKDKAPRYRCLHARKALDGQLALFDQSGAAQ